MDALLLLSALLMGVVEGLTEFLPISSTGHLILLAELLDFEGPPGKTFEITIQLGAVLAVIWVFRDTLLRMAMGMWRRGSAEYYTAVNLLLAFLPAMMFGATLHGYITNLLFTPLVVAIALILGGIVIIAIERMRPAPSIHSIPEIGPLAALLIGLGQALAMIPGTSRSGATIISALLVGVDRKVAAEFSFLLAIPTMVAATAFSLFKARNELDFSAAGVIALGFVAAFVVALVVVRWLLAVISRIGFTPFGWYRIALGAVILVWLALRPAGA
ncbi:undecaprenyl-diphosphate phosphatase [Roseomonas marmotae]|uniref:Undecaprenyl-diphosphatase n=1 Tax=Roseomonas marmotae TaxID=2768161 RepID=A0ABS3KDX0_9PROT|nr:undecaprenyl-diphosphate phosphatase [Roseomonas marmotae]MBO1075673.1 undecaprenyl-diphosphate phosphatase [Roseomonas marmotae]QTI79531.1 undecaprenyl-diphosphate phosphatase [Roseomonas marmotae]